MASVSISIILYHGVCFFVSRVLDTDFGDQAGAAFQQVPTPSSTSLPVSDQLDYGYADVSAIFSQDIYKSLINIPAAWL